MDNQENPRLRVIKDTAEKARAFRIPEGSGAWQSDAQPTRSTIAQQAEDAVYGPREADYGHPRQNLTTTAVIWTGLLQGAGKLAEGEYITADDVARCMIGVKLARDVHTPKRDNRVDGAGYFMLLDRLETGE